MRTLFFLFFISIPFLTYAQPLNNIKEPIVTDTISYPSLNKEWTPNELEEVFKNILLKQENSNPIYVSNTNRSHLYAKITSFETYKFLDNKNLDLNERIPLSLTLADLSKKFMTSYYLKGLGNNNTFLYDQEIVDATDLLCKITASQSRLMQEFISQNPDLNDIQKEGLEKMQDGYTFMVGGILITIEMEYNKYSQKSVCRLASIAKDFFKEIKEKMKAAVITDYENKIKQISKTHPYECVRNTIKLDSNL